MQRLYAWLDAVPVVYYGLLFAAIIAAPRRMPRFGFAFLLRLRRWRQRRDPRFAGLTDPRVLRLMAKRVLRLRIARKIDAQRASRTNG